MGGGQGALGRDGRQAAAAAPEDTLAQSDNGFPSILGMAIWLSARFVFGFGTAPSSASEAQRNRAFAGLYPLRFPPPLRMIPSLDAHSVRHTL
jgi:hypothetical protein